MEAACQVREVAAVGRHPSLVMVAEAVGEAFLDRRAVAEVVAAVAFRAREEVVGVHQIPPAVVAEGEEEEAGTG